MLIELFAVTTGLFIIILNSMVLLVFASNKKVMKVGNMLILYLSLVEVCFGVMYIPLCLGKLIAKLIGRLAYCSIVLLSVKGLFNLSVLTQCAIALDRYMSVLHCDFYRKYKSRKYKLLIIGATLVLSPSQLVLQFAGSSNKLLMDITNGTASSYMCRPPMVIWRRSTSFVLGFCIPSIIIFMVYLRLYFVARKRLNDHLRRFNEVPVALVDLSRGTDGGPPYSAANEVTNSSSMKTLLSCQSFSNFVDQNKGSSTADDFPVNGKNYLTVPSVIVTQRMEPRCVTSCYFFKFSLCVLDVGKLVRIAV